MRPGFVVIDGEEVLFEHGSYELRHYVNRKPVYVPANESPSIALAERDRLQRKLNARDTAEAAGVRIVDDGAVPRSRLTDKLREYVDDARKRGANEAATIGELVTREFLSGWRKLYVDEVTREDIFQYHAALRRKKNSDRTVANKHVRLVSALSFAGVSKDVFPPRPRFEEKLPVIYEPEDLKILDHLNERMLLVTDVMLRCGLRDQEVAHLAWSDINKTDRVLRVQSKREFGFEVKDSEQRDVPVPDDLFTRLEDWNERHPKQRLIFPTRSGKPDQHFLRQLKDAATRAGMVCGQCKGCNGPKRQACSRFNLHTFRRTYMTTIIRQGIDLRTAQAFAGHSTIASIMRYLRPETGAEICAKVNAIKWR